MGCDQVLRAALVAHARGRIEEAADLYDDVLRERPEDAVACHHRGIIYYQKRDFAAAEQFIQRSIALQTDASEAHYNLGAVLRERGRLEEAKLAYGEAVRLNARYGDAHNALAGILAAEGQWDEAIAAHRRAIAVKADFAEAYFGLGVALVNQQRTGEAIDAFRQVLALRPDAPEVHFNLAVALAAERRTEEATVAYRRAIALKPNFSEAHFGLGIMLVNQGRPKEAADAYRQVIALRPNAPEAYFNLAVALTAQGERDDAIAAYRQALAQRPNFPGAALNLGVALREQGRLDEAIEVCRHAIALKPDFPEMHFNLGAALAAQGKFVDALAVYRQAIALRPKFSEAFCGLGLALASMMQFDEAVAAYQEAVVLQPDFYEAHLNLAVALRESNRREEAIEASRRALALRPDDVDALINLGTLLREQWHLGDAVAMYHRAVVIDPGSPKANAQLAILRRQICDWSEFDTDTARVLDFFRDVEPFILFTTPSTAAQQLASAQNWASKITRSSPFVHGLAAPRRRIRLGYLSADFHRHATAYLLAELVERHDRSSFEVFGYSYGTDDGSEIRQRLVAGFEHFVDIRALSHAEAARRIYDDEIDVLVDLKGYTGRTRTEILVDRPAPVQVNYLGFPGTMGADFIDYIIADRFVAPFDQQAFFSERIVHLPDCYQCNDTKRPIAETAPTRSECGLPEEGLVFCSFNGAYKITPAVFAIWMRLLTAVPGSVLWLVSTNALCEDNLRRAAAAQGVDARRLIFCPPLHLPFHLARHRNADLFLDTLPVCAHTTASDALWAGLPIVTCTGQTFVSRVAGSLLNAVGLPELATSSLAEYEALALDLATNHSRLAAVKRKLAAQRLSFPLFDIARFTRHIEAAYRRMHEIRAAGQAPQPFSVGAC